MNTSDPLRNETIASLVYYGVTLDHIGRIFGISRQRIHRIAARYGVHGPRARGEGPMLPRVPVRVLGPNPHFPGAVLLMFTAPCPYCDRYHSHGSPIAGPGPDGTYGPRIPHCSSHRHHGEWCTIPHPQYVLIPAENLDDGGAA